MHRGPASVPGQTGVLGGLAIDLSYPDHYSGLAAMRTSAAQDVFILNWVSACLIIDFYYLAAAIRQL